MCSHKYMYIKKQNKKIPNLEESVIVFVVSFTFPILLVYLLIEIVTF